MDGSGEEAEFAEDFVGKTCVVEADPFFVFLEDFAKGLFDPKLFDLLVLNVNILLAKRVRYLENDKGISEVVLVLVSGDIIYFIEMATFNADDVGLVLVSMPPEGLHLQLLAFNKDAYSKLRDALVLTGDLHTILDDFVVFEGSRDEGLGIHGGDLAFGAQPKQASLAFDMMPNVVVVVVVIGTFAADEGTIEELKLSLGFA